MKTLYDLIGALPEDDADELRAAFRRAVKANHPDLHPDDPEASLEFRRIVRANAILSDPRQRQAYDQLLENARRQPPPARRRGAATAARRIGLDVMVSAAASVVFIGGYFLLKPADNVPRAPKTEISRIEPAPAAAIRSTELSSQDRAEREAGRTEIVSAPAAVAEAAGADQVGADGKHIAERIEVASLATEATIAGGTAAEHAAPPQATAPAPDTAPRDVNYYRRRAAAAYRSGDLGVALVNYDLAIELDTACSDCYVDRGIVLHRMGNLQAAFADVAEARRIEARNRMHSEARSH